MISLITFEKKNRDIKANLDRHAEMLQNDIFYILRHDEKIQVERAYGKGNYPIILMALIASREETDISKTLRFAKIEGKSTILQNSLHYLQNNFKPVSRFDLVLLV